MPLTITPERDARWEVRKIAVVGPGIVGMPMAALLASSRICEGSDTPARVVVVQRNSPTSGWKVAAINEGRSVIGGIEPGLQEIVAAGVASGLLSATHDYADVADADLILVSVQTDKRGFGPDYGPLFESLEGLALALRHKPAANVPVIVFESTLAPSSMATVVRTHFEKHGLLEGRDILLGNSPNRVMPGRLVERVAASDKLVAGLDPLTPDLIARIYRRIVSKGTLHRTNSMTAEFVKTLENAYRDVRIAFAAELARQCDALDIDFYALRESVNRQLHQSDDAAASATAVPSGAILIPAVGVGGHCLPKDGILLWWRRHESGADTRRSLILGARQINDESPAQTIALAERAFGPIAGKRVALMGTAYRFDSEDTRNSPTLALARLLIDMGCSVRLHDPYVKPDDQNLQRRDLASHFTNDAAIALGDAQIAVFCVGHRVYADGLGAMLRAAPALEGLVDGGNVFRPAALDAVARHVDASQSADGTADAGTGLRWCGIGRGRKAPPAGFDAFVIRSFANVERGVANELVELIDFLNERYASDAFNRVTIDTVRELAGSCVTGCAIAAPGPVSEVPRFDGFAFRLAAMAAR
ncbi:MAG: nucleotide sugar dehydrogenase [Lautropia sp.]